MKQPHDLIITTMLFCTLAACNDTRDATSAMPMPAPQTATVDAGHCGSDGVSLVAGSSCVRSSAILASARAQPLQVTQAASLEPTALFDWAESTYPGLFPGHKADQTIAPYLLRYYPETQSYMGVADGLVYGYGPYTGNVLVSFGKLADFSCTVLPASCGLPGAPQSVTAVAGNASATLSFTAPASSGGADISSYTASCVAGGQRLSASAVSSPISVTGLSNGTSYSCTVSASNVYGTGSASAAVVVTPVGASSGTFSLSSSAGSNGGTMPADYTCDGMGSSPQLSWSGAPAGTKEFAILMTTLPGDGTTKWNWVVYGIPATATAMGRDALGVGTYGVGSDGPFRGYQAPCSQGPGAKLYTFTVYALSGSPSLSGTPVSGQALASAIAPLTLASAALNLSYTRPSNPPGSTAACMNP
ncbi:fibronectin type III domain-containing protein [Chitinimonas sp.]|uniref:fibronectin type III domain-containing protein n=1 Tax=Chitinimonas sp. TaxID=1934313 RepID=UPI0035AFB5A6